MNGLDQISQDLRFVDAGQTPIDIQQLGSFFFLAQRLLLDVGVVAS